MKKRTSSRPPGRPASGHFSKKTDERTGQSSQRFSKKSDGRAGQKDTFGPDNPQPREGRPPRKTGGKAVDRSSGAATGKDTSSRRSGTGKTLSHRRSETKNPSSPRREDATQRPRPERQGGTTADRRGGSRNTSSPRGAAFQRTHPGRQSGNDTPDRKSRTGTGEAAADRRNGDRNTPPPREEAPSQKPRSNRSGYTPRQNPLNKYIAHCGICSRRAAVDHIKAGIVSVNGQIVTEPGYKVAPGDVVKLNGKRITPQTSLVYILLNKPKDYITTLRDPQGRRTVMELIRDATGERVYPVGRLDRNTSGLLLLTNDGELAQQMAHPSNKVKKVYHAVLDKPLTQADFDRILGGVKLHDGMASVDMLAYVDAADKTQIGLEIHSGRNRIVRRIFEHLGYQVEKLDRVLYAGLTKKNIPRGKWRLLTEKEVILLKHFTPRAPKGGGKKGEVKGEG
ncbi:pseudouridine synthase [Compostibacter hankyongensis]|uniref:Pseudouridine synthase n=1 Tax=Compostibacter hankyongensis TaxID=1007089 RepID=A0ABP8GAV0_9BACT